MDIELPSPEQVTALLPTWRAQHPRLDASFGHFGEPTKALRHMGLLLWQEGGLEDATRMFAAAASLAPHEAPLWSSLGGVLYAGGHRREAAACIRNALSRDPSPAADWLLLGTIYRAESDMPQAEDAFLRTLERDATSADAALSLGLLYMQTRRFAEADARLQAAIAFGRDDATVHACRAQVLSNLGDFPGAAAASAEASRRQPKDQALRRKLGQARFLETVLEGSAEEGFVAYRTAFGMDAEDPEKMTRDAFHLLSGYGFAEAAIRLGEIRQAQRPDDPVQSYLLAALKHEPIARAPDDYVVTYFDMFADVFDQQLVEVLDYHGPEKLQALVASQGKTLARIVDLGCGTGLAGPLLKGAGRVLTGVDLSPRMLEKAAARRLYDHLITSEAVTYLASQERAFDLIFAADFVVYLGDLAPLLTHAARALERGGLLALTIETTDVDDYRLLPSGRFAHRLGYVEDLACDAFVLRRQEATMIRLEANKPVDGALMLFERL